MRDIITFYIGKTAVNPAECRAPTEHLRSTYGATLGLLSGTVSTGSPCTDEKAANVNIQPISNNMYFLFIDTPFYTFFSFIRTKVQNVNEKSDYF